MTRELITALEAAFSRIEATLWTARAQCGARGPGLVRRKNGGDAKFRALR
jgi:hypothetical protein